VRLFGAFYPATCLRGIGAGGEVNGQERAIADARRQGLWLWALEDREFTVREVSVEDARWLAE
jgi:hypothetical protein